MDGLLQDFRLALRMLARAKGFTAVAVLTLALGTGSNTAIFSVLNRVLLDPLPYSEPEQLVSVWNRWENEPQGSTSPAEFLDYRSQAQGFESFGAYATGAVSVAGGAQPLRVQAAGASAGLFRALGVAPLLGRTFRDEEDTPVNRVAVLSHGMWQRAFGAERDVIGRSVVVDGETHTIIGVMPATFRIPDDLVRSQSTDLFLPIGIDPAQVHERGSHYLNVVGRLRSGVTRAQAEASLAQVAARFVAAFPDDYPADMRFAPHTQPLHERVIGDVRKALLLLLAAVGFVLLIACANVANLLIARAEKRQREMAVRAALGASALRIVRQLTVESLVLGLAGGGAGLLVAALAVEALTTLRPVQLPRIDEMVIDARVLAFAFATSLLTALLFGLVPALRASRPNVYGAIREGGRGATAGLKRLRVRRALIGTEVALALVLLAGAGLLLRSYSQLQAVDPGFRSDHVLTFELSLPSTIYESRGGPAPFYESVLERLRALPGVVHAGAIGGLPLASRRGDLNFQVEGRTKNEGEVSPRADWQVVTPGFFDAMRIAIVRGRGIDNSDKGTAPGAVVINETLAKRYWPGEDPLGQRFRLGGNAGPGWVTIVGIARDVRQAGLAEVPNGQMYIPHAQFRFWNGGGPVHDLSVAVRTIGAPAQLAHAIAREVHAVDPEIPVANIRTMSEVASASVATPRFAMLLVLMFSLTALVLACVGIYGVLAFSVAQRTQEIGIRMALGARATEVAAMVLRDGMTSTLAGLLAGLVLTLWMGNALRGMLYDVAPNDPATLAGVSLLLLGVAAAACTLPVLRATRVDPVVALRRD